MPSWAYNIIYTLEASGPSYWTTQQQSSNDGFLIYDTHTRKVKPLALQMAESQMVVF